MSSKALVPNTNQRPFDLAKESLSPRLREHGGLDLSTLPTSAYFRRTVESVVEHQFNPPLSLVISKELMDKVEKAAEWFRSLTERATGRQFAHNEPLVATGLIAPGCQQHPFILVRDAEVRAIETALPSAEWRKRIKEQSAQSEKSADETSSVAQKSASANVEKFNPKSTREARELSLQAIVIHELAHDIRGIQVGRTSTSAVRLGLRVNAFNGAQSDKRFSSLTEATAVLAEGRFLVEQGLTADRNWTRPYLERSRDNKPWMLAWKITDCP